MTGTKDQLGANNTPDNTGIVECASVGASKTLGLLRSANTLNVTTKEVVSSNLHNGKPDNGKCLSAKHAAGRNLHVVTDFHVRNIGETVVGHHVTPRLEQHHGNGAAGKHVTENHLGNDVQTSLLVGDGLNHADGNEEEETNEDTDNESPSGKMRWPGQRCSHPESK